MTREKMKQIAESIPAENTFIWGCVQLINTLLNDQDIQDLYGINTGAQSFILGYLGAMGGDDYSGGDNNDNGNNLSA